MAFILFRPPPRDTAADFDKWSGRQSLLISDPSLCNLCAFLLNVNLFAFAPTRRNHYDCRPLNHDKGVRFIVSTTHLTLFNVPHFIYIYIHLSIS